MDVVLTEAAYADLAAIGWHIKRDNPLLADSFVKEIYQRCQSLGPIPRAFPLIPGREDFGVRRRPFGPYLIFCRIEAEAVQILHILHGAQDVEAILFPQD